MDGISRGAAGHFALAAANGHNCGIAGFIYVDLVVALAKDREGKIGCIDFEGFILIEAAHTNIYDAFGEANLCGPVVKVQKRKTSVAGKANRGRATQIRLTEGIINVRVDR